MHKIYFHLEKGGTGKTISQYHLAWVFGELFEKRVLIVDLDAQKNLSFLFGIDGDKIISEGGYSIANCLAKDLNPDRKRKNIKECIYETIIPNVDLAIASSSIVQAEISILSELNRHLILNNALSEIEDEYDYVFIDTHSTYDQIFINAIATTDLVIPTMKTDFQNLQKFIDTMNNLEALQYDGICPEIGGVVCTTYENNTYQSNQCIDYLKENGYEIWGIIKKQVAVQDAAMNNLPIYRYAPSNQGSWAYIRTAHNILDHFDEDIDIPLDKKYRRKKMI